MLLRDDQLCLASKDPIKNGESFKANNTSRDFRSNNPTTSISMTDLMTAASSSDCLLHRDNSESNIHQGEKSQTKILIDNGKTLKELKKPVLDDSEKQKNEQDFPVQIGECKKGLVDQRHKSDKWS